MSNSRDFARKLGKEHFDWFLEWLTKNTDRFSGNDREKLTAYGSHAASEIDFKEALLYVKKIVVLHKDNKKLARKTPWLIQFQPNFDLWYKESWPECYTFRDNKAHIRLTLLDGINWTDSLLNFLGLEDQEED